MANTPDENSASPMANTPAVPAAAIFPASASTNQPVPTSGQLAETYSLSDPQPNAASELDWKGNVAGDSRTDADKRNSDQVGSTGKRLTKNSAWVLVGCNLLVFVSSVCVMVLELTASRLIAKHVGNSLYTWTSVIGVVLAGITIGNFLGGWLADRVAPSKVLNWLFLTASILCMSVLWLDGVASGQQRPDSLSWPAWVVCVVGMVFFLPSMALGTISPVVASLALSHSRKIGATVGNVYAWGALGSIIGTFLGGFVLIDTLGTRAIIALVAGTLAAMGFLSAGSQWAFRSAVLFGWMQFVTFIGLAASITEVGMRDFTATLAGESNEADDPFGLAGTGGTWSKFGKQLGRQLHELGLTLGLREDNRGEYHDESNYSYINVSQSTENGERVAVLKLDKLIHSYYVLDSPTELNYDYEKVYAAVTEQAVATWDRTTTISLADVRRGIEQQRQKDADRLHPLPLGEGRGEGLDALDEAARKVLEGDSNETKSEQKPDADGGAAVKKDGNENRSADESLTRPSATLSQGERGQDGDSLSLAEIGKRLPSWVTFDPEKQTLSLHGGMTPELRTDLLRRHPYSNYWQAVERLREMTRRSDWGDFGSVPLASLPNGVVLPERFTQKLIYDRHLQALNAYRALDAEDVQTLLNLGDIEAATYREAVERLYRQSRQIGTLFLGGGGFVFPRWIESLFPHEPLIHVAELDPGVKAAVRAKMGLPPDDETRVKTTIGDARNFVEDRVRWNAEAVKRGEKPVLYDFVYGDAFNDFSVPWHLTTKEFSEKIEKLLHPTEGVYQVNLIDIYPRTEFPSHRDKFGDHVSDPSERVEGDVPEVLTRYVTDPGDWAAAPAPFEGLEVTPTQDYAGVRLAVRGVMSDPLRDRLLKLADGKPGFALAVRKLYDDSHKQRTGRFLGSYVHTISYVFPFVYVFSSETYLPHSNRDTFVIIASKRKLDLTNLRQASNHWSGAPFASLETSPKGEKLARGQMGEILANAYKMVLTDDFAPVDNLLSAVFDER
jgi:hypothetical protein